MKTITCQFTKSITQQVSPLRVYCTAQSLHLSVSQNAYQVI